MKFVVIALALTLGGCATGGDPCALRGKNNPLLTSAKDTQTTQDEARIMNDTGARLGCWPAR